MISHLAGAVHWVRRPIPNYAPEKLDKARPELTQCDRALITRRCAEHTQHRGDTIFANQMLAKQQADNPRELLMSQRRRQT